MAQWEPGELVTVASMDSVVEVDWKPIHEAVYLFFHMFASSYVAGRAVRPLNPVVSAKPLR